MTDESVSDSGWTGGVTAPHLEVEDGRPLGAGDDPTASPDDQRSRRIRLAGLVGLFAALGLVSGLNVVAVVLAIVVSIFLHELGHFWAAKRSGMKVTEFFIGFGPKIWSFRRGETEYGVKLIWAGAYVKIIGMSTLEEVAVEDEARTFRNKSYPKRVLVAFAGPSMNFILAFVLLFGLFAGFGQAEDRWPQLRVSPAGPAEAAGLETGDELVSFAGRPVGEFDDLRGEIVGRAGETVPVVVLRDGLEQQIDVVMGGEDHLGRAVGFFGVGPASETRRLNPIAAVGEAGEQFVYLSGASTAGLVDFFLLGGIRDMAGQVADNAPGAGSSSVTDPEPASEDQATAGAANDSSTDEEQQGARVFSILGIVIFGSQLSAVGIVGLMALMNIFLGLFNLVPLLPFDGGHIIVATYERIREALAKIGLVGARLSGARYYADFRKLIPLTYAVVAVVVLVGIGALYLDAVDPPAVPN